VKRTLVWVFLAICAWFVVSVIARTATALLGWPLQALSADLADWVISASPWLSSAVAGLAAYWLVRLLRTVAGAPRTSWLGVLFVEVLGFVVSARGLLPSSNAQEVLPLLALYLPAALFPVLGAWLAARRPDPVASPLDPIPESLQGS
jgi:hypothetical protein